MKPKVLLTLIATTTVGVAAVVYVCSFAGGPAPASADISKVTLPSLPPKAVLDHTTFDFGVMDVGQKGKHTFLLRNEGAGPLRVRSGGTSCKCTLLEAADGTIPPGQERQLHIEWETLEPSEHYRHGATLYTDDPKNSQLDLFILGKVRTFCGISPDVVTFADMLPTERRTQSVVVYSQTWNDFAIADVVSPDPHVTYRLQPADQAALAKLGALSGYEVEISLEPGLQVGKGRNDVRVLLDVPSDPKIEKGYAREIPVLHEIVGNFTIYGRNVEGKTLRMGAVPRQLGAKASLSMYVRGEHRELDIREIHAEPDYLRVNVRRDEKVQGKTARYLIDVEVPRETPVVDRMSQNPGKVELVSDHPKSPRVHFNVEFAVFE